MRICRGTSVTHAIYGAGTVVCVLGIYGGGPESTKTVPLSALSEEHTDCVAACR
jgi:hypothetical protein